METRRMSKRRYRAEREFGLIVGGVLVLLSTWWFYRAKFPAAREVAITIGGLLVILAIIFPRALVWPNRAWMAFAEVLSVISTKVILAIVFFLIITPIGIVKRMFGWDPLNRRAAASGSYWQDYPERQRDARHYEKMY